MKKGLAIIIILLFTISSCNEKYKKTEGFAQGTTYHITYQSKKDFSKEIDSLLKHFNTSLSTYEENSIISRINKNDTTVRIDSLFETFFNTSYNVYIKTYGYFDITVAPIVNAWGFGFTEKTEIDSMVIDSLLKYVGMDKLFIAGFSVFKNNKNIMLDGNAIAQGQSVDYIANFLEKNKISNYLVEIGGEVRVKGKNQNDKLWTIGIDKPVYNSDETNRELQAILQLQNKSLATSGNYRKFYEKNGIKYSHTINPKTGYPVQHKLLSATVITDDCINADAYATACMVMGLLKAKDLIKELKNTEAYFIYTDDNNEYKVFMTEGIKKMLIDTN